MSDKQLNARLLNLLGMMRPDFPQGWDNDPEVRSRFKKKLRLAWIESHHLTKETPIDSHEVNLVQFDRCLDSVLDVMK